MTVINPPKPTGAPATGVWKDIGDNETDGNRQMNYVDNNAYWFSLQILDCRIPGVKAAESQKPDERGDFDWCFTAPNDKFKDYPMIKPEKTSMRVVKAGNLLVIAGLGMAGQEKLKGADVETFLGQLDLAAIGKL